MLSRFHLFYRNVRSNAVMCA